MKRPLLNIMLLLFGIGVFVGLLFYKGYLRCNYPSDEDFPVKGIDISHHQSKINWEELKSEDIDFVYMKATEGVDFVDPEFCYNWDQAKNNNYHVGAYHFYSVCKNGREQAGNFIQTVPKEGNNMPPVLDLEFVGNCKTDKTKEQILMEIQSCLNVLEDYYGQVPVLFVTNNFYSEYIIDEFDKYPIWIRNIYLTPELPDNREWTFWQFANRAHLKGIEEYVDLNVFNGDIDDLKRLKQRR